MLLATAQGAIAVPFDVVVSKVLPFAITLRRGMLAPAGAMLPLASDDEEDEDEDGSIADLTAVLSAAAVGGPDDDLDDEDSRDELTAEAAMADLLTATLNNVDVAAEMAAATRARLNNDVDETGAVAAGGADHEEASPSPGVQYELLAAYSGSLGLDGANNDAAMG